jgi:hypothetical protein
VTRFASKPHIVEAMVWTGTNTSDLALWLNQNAADTEVAEVCSLSEFTASKKLIVATPYGQSTCWPGDWLVIQGDGTVITLNNSIFVIRYEEEGTPQ